MRPEVRVFRRPFLVGGRVVGGSPALTVRAEGCGHERVILSGSEEAAAIWLHPYTPVRCPDCERLAVRP